MFQVRWTLRESQGDVQRKAVFKAINYLQALKIILNTKEGCKFNLLNCA